MIRQAVASDAERIEGFLANYPDTSMFLHGNLEAHGIGRSDHAHASDYFLWPAEGPRRAVFGRSNSGYLILQCRGCEAEACAAAGALVAQTDGPVTLGEGAAA